MKNVTLLLNVRLPNHISTITFRRYVKEALQTYKGCMDPESDIFNLNLNRITLREIKKEKKK